MKRIVWLSATLLTLVLILAGGLALILTTHPVEFDATPFKDRISAAVLERTGLEMRVDGELHLRIGSSLSFDAAGLHLRNPALSEAGELLAAEQVTLAVEALPILEGRIEPTYLRLEGAKLDLVRGRAGNWNWQAITLADAAHAAHAAEREAGSSVDALLFPDALHAVGKDVRIAYKDSRTGTVFTAVMKTVDLDPSESALKIELDGSVDEFPLVLRGTTAVFSEVIKGGKPVPLDLQGNLLGLKVTARGNLAHPRTGAEVSAALRIEGESLAGLQPWVGEQIAGRGPVKASLNLTGGDKHYELGNFQVAVGKGRFDGGLKLDLSGQKPSLNLELGIEEVDLKPLFERDAADAGHPGSEKKGDSRGLFTNDPLSVGWMDALDLTAHIRLRNLITPYTSVRNIDMEAALSAGDLSVKGAGKDDDGRSESFDFRLNSSVEPLVAELRYKGDKLLLEPLLAGTQARGMIEGEVDISADLKATGFSSNQLAGSLSGRFLFLIERATADLRHLDRLTPGVVNLFGQLARPNAKSAKLNCGLAAFDFKGGRTHVNILVDTPDSTVVADGDLDLGSERLDVRVTPNAKGVHLKVAAPVVIHGSLATPEYRVEKGHLLVSLTELASKVAVPQLLLVDAFGAAVAQNPCVKIASGKSDPGAAGPLEAVAEPVETVVKGAGAIVKGAGSVVKEAGGALVKGTGNAIKGVGGAIGGLLGGGRSQDESPASKEQENNGAGSFLDE